MKREVRQFMPEHLTRIAGIGAGAAPLHNDSLLRGNRDGGAILGRVRSDEFRETPSVGRYENEHSRQGTWQPRKRVPGDSAREKGPGERRVVRSGSNRESTLVEALQPERELRVEVRRAGRCKERSQREGEPPPSTSASMAAHRFPHGLNLPAATPSRHA